MPLLTPADFQAVRQALDTSFDEEVLPDETVSLDIYQIVGESYVFAAIPTADTLVNSDPRIKIAAVFYVAAELAPVVPHIVRENYGQYSYQLADRDWSKLQAELRRKAELQIAAVIGSPVTDSTDLMPTIFTVASVDRHIPFPRRWYP
jgi:hypothetical protein